ncbi:hypothetical protein RI129_010002 [Pyrocoelia pectoralis]|uniref:Uncharacterized protein n=1 Tax=Pyrocoelia pectoralis TaxID=417401 RepID=A0AAN7V3K9_9COLE
MWAISVITIMCLSLAIGKYCERLYSLYESFGCKPYDSYENVPTKYDCTVSSYKTEYVEGMCYFNGTFYSYGEMLQQRYPRTAFQDVCDYFCAVSVDTGLGPYFEYDNCVNNESSDVSGNECVHDVLSNMDLFSHDWAPVFFPGDKCPFFWIADEPSNLISDDCSENPKTCCKYLNYTMKTDRKFQPTNSVTCECTCPPIIECLRN